jgi:hypothetical protein
MCVCLVRLFVCASFERGLFLPCLSVCLLARCVSVLRNNLCTLSHAFPFFTQAAANLILLEVHEAVSGTVPIASHFCGPPLTGSGLVLDTWPCFAR